MKEELAQRVLIGWCAMTPEAKARIKNAVEVVREAERAFGDGKPQYTYNTSLSRENSLSRTTRLTESIKQHG